MKSYQLIHRHINNPIKFEIIIQKNKNMILIMRIEVLINRSRFFQRIAMKMSLFQPKCLILTRFLEVNDKQKDHINLHSAMFLIRFEVLFTD